MTKRVLGLDLGTNSIGWALVEIDRVNHIVKILGLGSRILPMDSGEIKKFESGGKIESTASQRTTDRGARKQNQRFILRRDRLHLVLNLLKALPEHYAIEIDFEKNGKKCGQFKENSEPKIPYKQNEENSKHEFYFEEAFNEMIADLQKVNPNIKNEKGHRVPKDWTLYYLRNKALKEKISLEELSWVLLSYNQKRGYEKLEVENKSKENQIEEHLELKVENVTPKTDKQGQYYEIELNDIDKFTYKEYSNSPLTKKGDVKELIKILTVDNEGNIDKKKTKYSITDIYNLTIKDSIYQKIENKNTPHQYEIVFENGWKNTIAKKKYTSQYDRLKGKSFDYIIEADFDASFNLKARKGKDRTFREPDYSEKSNDWTLLKKKTEKEAIQFNVENGYVDKKTGSVKNYISPKIYDVLTQDANKIYDVLKQDAKTGNRTKIIGGMFQVVERKFYREELNQIIENQRKHHSNLEDKKIFEDCVKLLYPNNKQHAENLLKNKKAIQHLLIEDILLYQRELKSKKSEIADCKYEVRHWEHTGKEITDEVTGEIYDEIIPHYHKVVAVSHPLYQEFRIWDKIHNLKLIQVEKVDGKNKNTNEDVTEDYFKSEEDYQALFELFNNQKTVNQKQFLKFCGERFNLPKNGFVWNYPEEEELKGNETRVSLAFRFKRCGFTAFDQFLTQEKEITLWHYLYSVNYKERNNNDKKSCKTFFNNLFKGVSIDDKTLEKLIIDFANYPKFDTRYGAYSEKALKKLLPFMRKFGERFNGAFYISEEFKQHLKAVEYKEKNIYKYLKLDKEAQKERTKEERKKVEQLKQDIYQNLWKHRINNRILEILEKLSKIDFSEESIDYSKVVKVEVDEQQGELAFPKGLFNVFRKKKKVEDFFDLNLTQASYLVYGRHSELAKAKYWKSPEQVRKGIVKELKQHSLNNPIAEKVLREMMQVVADIWVYFGKGEENYFSKIHLEVGRELKKSASEKKQYTDNQTENRNQNKRLRNILKEFLSVSPYNAISNNSDHFERLKIVENSMQQFSKYSNEANNYFKEKGITKKEIEDLLKEPKISKTQFEKYKLWIEQGYQSPYTGQIIPLSELFDGNKYNIDHIFPRASVTNDSLNNKVVCEVDVNKHKSSLTGREYILKYGGKPIEYYDKDENKQVKFNILSDENYVSLVKKKFSKNKQFILLAKEIPSGFTSSQLNNSRHIARKAMELLSHIVREEGEVEFRSKNVLPVTGRVTSELKQAWRLNEVWKELLSPRFKRLNELTQSNLFGSKQTNKQGHTYFDCNLHESIREQNPDYDIKRLDHRHHALDALVVALCTEEHVQYINNINAGIDPKKKNNKKKLAQIQKQRTSLKQKIKYSVPNKKNPKNKDWYYLPPCAFHNVKIDGYGKDSIVELAFIFDKQKGHYKDIVLNALENVVVTFKSNNRVINKTVNKYEKYNEKGKKTKDNQQEPKRIKDKSPNKYNWVIRRSLGKDTFYGKVNLKLKETKKLHSSLKVIYNDFSIVVDKELRKELKHLIQSNNYKVFSKKVKEKFENNSIDLYYFTNRKEEDQKVASRYKGELNGSFSRKKIASITDVSIQKMLEKHLKRYDTVLLEYEEALPFFENTLEKEEINTIINNNENKFSSLNDFTHFLKANGYKYKNVDYSKLNVLIEAVSRDFRNEKDDKGNAKFKVIEHPDIAFSPEVLTVMNQPEYLKELNNGKAHCPIKKVRTYTKLGEKRSLNKNPYSVKSKQHVINDAGSNLFLGIYEGIIEDKKGNKEKVRKFEGIGLMDLIELLKEDKSNRFAPLPDKIFDDKQNEYNLRFSLSPNELVYVPTKEERELQQEIDGKSLVGKNVSKRIVDIENLSSDQKKRIFTVNNFTKEKLYFSPVHHSVEIFKKEVDMRWKDNKVIGSEENKTEDFEGGKIKYICWKLKVNRIGKIEGIIK